jgi:hypothetical protein
VLDTIGLQPMELQLPPRLAGKEAHFGIVKRLKLKLHRLKPDGILVSRSLIILGPPSTCLFLRFPVHCFLRAFIKIALIIIGRR